MSTKPPKTTKNEPSAKAELAPQPGETNTKDANSSDAILMFLLSLGKFFRSIFKISVLSYCFWTVMLYTIGATLLIVAFRSLSPSIGNVPACPAKKNGFILATLWYLMSVANFSTAYAYHTIEQSGSTEFEHLTLYAQTVGFLIKVVPIFTRLFHVVNLCQLNVMTIQILFLPECNAKGLVVVFGLVFLIWWLIVIFGMFCKHMIFIPPHLYSPLRPGRTFFQEIEKMMTAFGP